VPEQSWVFTSLGAMTSTWDAAAPPVPRLVVPVRIDPHGLSGPTKGQARGPSWRLTSPGRVVPASVTDALVEQRIMEAYAGCGPASVVTGWASLRLQGGGYFDGLARDGKTRLCVPVASNGGRVRSRSGIEVVRHTVPHDEIVVVHGIRCAVVERAVFDEVRLVGARSGDEWDQIAVVDLTCAAQMTSIRRMARYRWARYWYRDIRTLDRILPHCCEGVGSPREVDFRKVWTQDAGWPRPLCNPTILDLDGVVIGMPDLFDPIRGVAGEYAGAGHRGKHQHDSDLSRAAAFRRVGVEAVEVTNTHLGRSGLVARWLAEAEERAALLPRHWQLAASGPSLDSILDRRDRHG
jgi:hypothetical protein